ncbi:hypothetical protein [Alkalihalobacillus sp. TS-13]|uniref:hypothetical protein n=1 Tax=Alkalihalobacillus sp. TS-13 TaxID=2842455 RepID=UPI001C878836|nr:hypothetical protein [Alkalihalobacillus sp. TS-13]
MENEADHQVFLGKKNDIGLQYRFWETVTAELPYAWKPIFSPKLFLYQKEFDPKSRCFAFDGDRLVSHMSFTGKGNFVSLANPQLRCWTILWRKFSPNDSELSGKTKSVSF